MEGQFAWEDEEAALGEGDYEGMGFFFLFGWFVHGYREVGWIMDSVEFAFIRWGVPFVDERLSCPARHRVFLLYQYY